jgi:hypothetical protein
MNPADEEGARLVPTERPSAGGAAASGEESDQQLRTILEDLGRVAHQDEHYSGFTPYLDQEASERKALYDRLGAIEGEMKRRRSGGFVRYLVAILIGVAATLAWQSYGEAAKQIIATRAQELGWSPEAKQMIASWTLGWTKPPASPVAPKAPPAPSIDPAQVQQMVQSLATVRETVQEVAARQEQTARDIASLESAVAEILLKTPEPPPQPPAAPARKPTPTTPSSRAPIAPRLPPHP